MKRFDIQNREPKKAGKKGSKKTKKAKDIKARANHLTTGQDTFNKIAGQAKKDKGSNKASPKKSGDNNDLAQDTFNEGGQSFYNEEQNKSSERQKQNRDLDEEPILMMEIELDGAKTQMITVYKGQQPLEIA